jgi:hypothetical protein
MWVDNKFKLKKYLSFLMKGISFGWTLPSISLTMKTILV